MKKTLVVGLGKSGIAASRLLKAEKRSIFITEAKDTELIRSSIKDLIKDNVVQKNNFEIGKHTDRFLKDCNLLVVSPGVKSDSLPIKLAEDKNIPIIGELELAYSLCPAPIIAVTGTSGKTTVTTLIGSMLKASGRDVIVCGNIGTPLSSELKRIKKDSIVVLEVSSFQLERIKNFKPKISVILNISENHLDRHKDMEEYISLKMKIFSNQDKRDILFLNGRDKSLKGFIRDIKPKVEFFDEYKDFKKTYSIENENYLASMAVSSLEGVDEKTMLDVLLGFKGIEHRLEYVTAINGVDFINDSRNFIKEKIMFYMCGNTQQKMSEFFQDY